MQNVEKGVFSVADPARGRGGPWSHAVGGLTIFFASINY